MVNRNLVIAIAAGCSLALSGCQTTQQNTFSEWKNIGSEQARFNALTVLNVPVSAVQQRSRNNGQVLDEDITLACGQGQVHIEHVPTGWFSTATISSLKSRDAFESKILKTAKPDTKLEGVTYVENETGSKAGYFGNLVTPDGESCQVAKFGIRGKKELTFDNDRGAIDTYVEMKYCGDTALDTESFISSLQLSKYSNPTSPAEPGSTIISCPTVYETAANSDPLDNQRQAEMTLIWPGSFYGSQKLTIEYNKVAGAFNVALSDTNQCKGHYAAKSPETPFEARWWVLCDDGQSARGYFYPENAKSLMGKGQDAKGVEILLGIEL
ncbi:MULTISPECIES: hypothetical protein [Thalassospira]|uniref:SH3 domain-containing protein n=1 Tax=Thalassospira povalilytica TaxID=732237 RepID=A0ABX4RE60_9PROT|nr:hypothetical protein [Thalassospira povalilytica]PKR52685.1 hypothetical protein CU041_03660 [Thalassospira povalilytica]